MATDKQFTNRLIHETSPYLRQHAHNPVDWFPWSKEALQKAKDEDKPIFLSIGYSACHWCHVMEHESFEDPEVGAFLNEHFVSIKVDREERPDLDQIYMAAVQLLTRSGGWPMSMFLTPNLQPFYGGTYYPPKQMYGRPSFRQVLEAIVDAFANKRESVEEQARELTSHVQLFGALEPNEHALNEEVLSKTARQLGQVFDADWGGFGSAPKFPHAMELRLLLRVWHRFGDRQALDMVTQTLDRMALGGLYDQLGGGFHRYSTDRMWLAPHFEKMLYDNALLVPAYLDAYQVTKNPFYEFVVKDTLAYVRREMVSPEGAFFSTQDADSEGEEGKFFVWSKREIVSILGEELAELFCDYYDVSESGNWEGHNILNLNRWSRKVGKQSLSQESEQVQTRLREAREKLLEVRSKRIWPGRDEKILTSWNALMIDAFAQAHQVFPDQGYAETAENAAKFLLESMEQEDGRLYRTWFSGTGAKLNGYLEDYAFLIHALISLYEATFRIDWMKQALGFTDIMIEQFWDDAQGGFFYTGKNHEQLIARGKDPHDGSIPSGNSMAVSALLRLAKFTGRTDLTEKATETLQLYADLLQRSSQSVGQILLALEYHLGPVDEFVVLGDGSDSETTAALELIRQEYRPRKIVVFQDSRKNTSIQEAVLPILKNKSSSNQVTVYICRNFTCSKPCTGLEELKSSLQVLKQSKSDI